MKKTLLILILFPLTLMAQVERENPGPVDVSGRVVNVSGEALPGASLWLVNQADTLKKFGTTARRRWLFRQRAIICACPTSASGPTWPRWMPRRP